ncbi:retrovirus-related pol polyprotein from transposon TNT 1-94, partial [Tanacetum coccineum]
QGSIFNANKEIVPIAPRRNDVYVLDMSSLTPNGACFFAKALESVNWLWNERLSHLNFKNINKLAKQNKVLVLPSLVYSKDKLCTACEKGNRHRASIKTKQNFSIRKCLHLLHMDLFGLVSPMSINHEKYTLVIFDEYSRYTWVHFLRKKSQAPKIIMSFIRMVENQNDVKFKQIRTDNGTEFRNHKLESFCDENGVAERKNRTPIKTARIMLNGLERIPDISYFHVFGCPVFIHKYKDHLGNFDAKADDGYFIGYSFVSKAFRVFNTRRQQVEETYHVTFDESMEAIRFTNTSVDEIGIDDSSRYPLDEFIQEDDPSRQYKVDSNLDIPHIEDTEGPPDLINIEGTHEKNVHNNQMITQPTDIPSGNNIEDRWLRDQHIERVNIIGDLGEGMLTRSMAAKLIASSAIECLFADFLSKIEPKKVSEALKHLIWVDAMQEELDHFYRNK